MGTKGSSPGKPLKINKISGGERGIRRNLSPDSEERACWRRYAVQIENDRIVFQVRFLGES
jgi:hypothetical protein